MDKWKLKLEGREGPEEIGEVGVGNWEAQIGTGKLRGEGWRKGARLEKSLNLSDLSFLISKVGGRPADPKNDSPQANF